jgi:hypothetical protein
LVLGYKAGADFTVKGGKCFFGWIMEKHRVKPIGGHSLEGKRREFQAGVRRL